MKRRTLLIGSALALLQACAAVPPPREEISAPERKIDPTTEPAAPVPVPPQPEAEQTPDSFVSVREFIPRDIDTGTAECTPYIQDALRKHPQVFFPSGVYLLKGQGTPSDGVELQDGQEVLGAGPKRTIIRQDASCKNAFSVFHGSGGTSSTSGNKKNITLRGLQFEGFDNPLWRRFVDQWFHCLTIHSASELLVEDCEFRRFRGD